MADQKSTLKIQADGTKDQKYLVTGAGERHIAQASVQPDRSFTKDGFDGALRQASRRVSEPARGKKRT
jgi:hypothetical protein